MNNTDAFQLLLSLFLYGFPSANMHYSGNTNTVLHLLNKMRKAATYLQPNWPENMHQYAHKAQTCQQNNVGNGHSHGATGSLCNCIHWAFGVMQG